MSLFIFGLRGKLNTKIILSLFWIAAFAVSTKASSQLFWKPGANTWFHGDAKFGVFVSMGMYESWRGLPFLGMFQKTDPLTFELLWKTSEVSIC